MVSDIDFEVVNLLEEVVLVSELVLVISCVRVGINDGYVFEVSCGFKSWNIFEVVDYMGVIVLLKGFGYEVCVWWEEYKCRCVGVWVIVIVIMIFIGSDSSIYCGCVVSWFIVFCIVVFYVMKDRIIDSIGFKRDFVSLFNIFELLISG